MKKTTLLSFLLFFSLGLLCQNMVRGGSTFVNIRTERYGNLILSVDSSMRAAERKNVVSEINGYISQCLDLIGETVLDDSIHIVLASSRDEVQKLSGSRVGGLTRPKGRRNSVCLIFSVYGKEYSPLKHEIMHAVSFDKWGSSTSQWLKEGLATLAGFDCIDNAGYTLQELYLFLLQNNKLLSPAELNDFSMRGRSQDVVRRRMFYNQSGYIVQYMLENYGAAKVRELWKGRISDFEKIFGCTFRQMMDNMNSELNTKYPDRIEVELDAFTKDGIE